MVERRRGRAGQQDRKRRLDRTDGLCERCAGLNRWAGFGMDRVTLSAIVNHIIPLAQGGPDTDENTENLCRPCDKIVTAEQFGHAVPIEARGVGDRPAPTIHETDCDVRRATRVEASEAQRRSRGSPMLTALGAAPSSGEHRLALRAGAPSRRHP